MTDDDVQELAGQLIHHVADLVIVLDESATVRWANRRAEEVLGYSVEEWLGRPGWENLHPDDLVLGLELLVSAKATGAGVKEPVQYRFGCADGSWITVEAQVTNVAMPNGELAMIICARPVDQRRAPEAVVGEVAERIALMFEGSAIGMLQVALDGKLLRVNSTLAGLLGRTREELVGQSLLDHAHPDDAEHVGACLHVVATEQAPTNRASFRGLASDGTVVHLELTATLVRDHLGQPMYCAVQALDVTALRAAEADLRHLAEHDSLTGLANRTRLQAVLEDSIARPGAGEQAIAAVFVDLDGFKAVNDTHGHSVGDELLVAVADRLRAAVRKGDVISRVGGDEFILTCLAFESEAEVVGLAERMVAGLAEPFELSVGTVVINACAGVAVDRIADTNPDRLIRDADGALYEAKRAGPGQVALRQRTA